MLSRASCRLPTRAVLLSPNRHVRARGPKTLGTVLKEVGRSFVGDFTFKGAAENLMSDIKFITGPVSNYADDVIPLRIDTARRVTRFTKTHSDSEYGGKSNCSSRILNERPSDEDIYDESKEDTSFVRFRGELNFPENKDAKIKTTGFCAAQAVCRKVIDLSDYEGLELVIRSKEARSYIFGMKTMSLSMLNDMQYQIKLDVPAGDEWLQYHIPWSYFSLTRGGKMCGIQRVNDNMQLESMTFLVTREQGPFQLDIKAAVAHPVVDKGQVQKMLPYEGGEYGTRGRAYK